MPFFYLTNGLQVAVIAAASSSACGELHLYSRNGIDSMRGMHFGEYGMHPPAPCTEPVVIADQPLETLAAQLAEDRKTTGAEISPGTVLLDLLLNSMRKETKSSHKDTIFHAAGIEILQRWVTRLNQEHNLRLTTDDLKKSFSPLKLATILCAQLSQHSPKQ
jgi:hypothetical protein